MTFDQYARQSESLIVKMWRASRNKVAERRHKPARCSKKWGNAATRAAKRYHKIKRTAADWALF